MQSDLANVQYIQIEPGRKHVSFLEIVCCVPIWFLSKLKSRHAITWLILSALLLGVALVLFVYIVPLAEKANLVADEARELVKVSLEKIERVDNDVALLIVDAREKIDSIHSNVSSLVKDTRGRLENIDNTVQSFIINSTLKIDRMEQRMDATTTSVQGAGVL